MPSMLPALSDLPAEPGTYVLVLELPRPAEIVVGRLGSIRFEGRFCMYFGSALGPGGLAARLRRHLGEVVRPHWHIDYLRAAARVRDVWIARDDRRLECLWYAATAAMIDASPVPRFGSSDCTCRSHLLALQRRPTLAALAGALPFRTSKISRRSRTVCPESDRRRSYPSETRRRG